MFLLSRHGRAILRYMGCDRGVADCVAHVIHISVASVPGGARRAGKLLDDGAGAVEALDSLIDIARQANNQIYGHVHGRLY